MNPAVSRQSTLQSTCRLLQRPLVLRECSRKRHRWRRILEPTTMQLQKLPWPTADDLEPSPHHTRPPGRLSVGAGREVRLSVASKCGDAGTEVGYASA